MLAPVLIVVSHWKITFIVFIKMGLKKKKFGSAAPTNDAKDAQNVGSKNHQHVDKGEQSEGNGNVTQPVESLGGKQHLQDGPAYLRGQTKSSVKGIGIQYCFFGGGDRRRTYRKEHDGDSQRHGCEDGDSHAQDQRIIRVNPAVSVQKFWLHAVCKKCKEKRLLIDKERTITPCIAVFKSVTTRGSFGCIC